MIDIILNDLETIIIEPASLSGKSVLITGASGLIGVYFLTYLKKYKIKYNIKITALVKNEIDENFSEIFEDIELIISDITDLKLYERMDNFDLIIHSAGYGQPNKFLHDKIKTIEINTTVTNKLFTKLNTGGKFIFMSTSELYSGLENDLITEESIGVTTPSHPRACYIEGKRTGESICNVYSEMGYDVKIIRLSLAYGPGTKKFDHRVLNSFIERALIQKKIFLLDSGDSIRTYCYISDVVEMMLNIIFYGKSLVYNLGGQSRLTILELANIIGEITEAEVLLPEIPQTITGNPKIVNISIDKYFIEFGNKKFIPIKEGLIKTINWQKKLYDNEKNNN